MQYLGDYKEDYATLNFKFATHKADGTPITLAGSPAVKVYKANATDSETTTGVTLTVGFDSVTGLHNVLIDLSADAFYAVGNDYSVVITAGTVDSISVVGTVLAHFSIENRNIKADLVSILGTALTETAGYLAAAFKKFFNIETPVGTVNKIPATLAATDVSGNVPVDVSAIQTGLATATNVSDAKDEIIEAMPDSAAAVILPVMQGRVYTATAIQGREVVIVQGNTPRIPFNLFDDYSGWTPLFGAKVVPEDTLYAINPKEAIWLDASAGQGYIDLTAAETATVGKFQAEIKVLKGDHRHTGMKFTLKIIAAVITA